MGMRITSPLAYFRVQGVIAFSTLRFTSRQTYLSESFRRIAPGSIPASSRIWNPLQMPIRCPPRWAPDRHLQRVPDPAGGRDAARRNAPERLAQVRLPRREPQGRECDDALD